MSFRFIGRTGTFVLSLLAFAIAASAQESIRPSSTGEQAARFRTPTDLPLRYNMKAGPLLFDASTALDVEFNDNVGISEKDRESDLILRPVLRIDSLWRMTQLNTLRLTVGVGYSKYLDHGDLDTKSVLLEPGSELAFDIYVGDFLRLNIHDRFAIVQNPVDEISISNASRFDRFQNQAGITATADLNDLQLVLGYDHFTYSTFDDKFDFLDRSEEQVFGSASVQLSDALTVGVDSSAAWWDYESDYNNNGWTLSAGPFVEAVLSPYSRLRVSGGYQMMDFDDNGTSGDVDNSNGWYATAALAQRLNQYWSHSISVGHETRLGLAVNFAEYTFARYVAAWRVNTRTTASIDGFVEKADESGTEVQGSEDAFRWGAGVGITRRLGENVTLGLRYRFVDKDSDLPLRSYYQNIGVLSIGWDF